MRIANFVRNEAFTDALAQSTIPSRVRVQPHRRSSAYATLLGAPARNIAGNVPERPDANSAAILDYN